MNINPLEHTRIGIATTYGKPYYKFVKSLQNLNLKFDSILPDEIESYEGNLILTTKNEAPKNLSIPMFHEEILDQHPTVIRGMMLRLLDTGFENEELIIGVDPGGRIGLSVFYFGKEIESSLHSSVDSLVDNIISILAGLRAKRKIVKIGNGNMEIAKKIGKILNLKFCSSFELEFVDEQRTSMKIKNYNQRGKRDRLSAKYITQREGYRHFVLPLSITG